MPAFCNNVGTLTTIFTRQPHYSTMFCTIKLHTTNAFEIIGPNGKNCENRLNKNPQTTLLGEFCTAERHHCITILLPKHKVPQPPCNQQLLPPPLQQKKLSTCRHNWLSCLLASRTTRRPPYSRNRMAFLVNPTQKKTAKVPMHPRRSCKFWVVFVKNCCNKVVL